MAKENKGRPNTSVNIDSAKVKKLMKEKKLRYADMAELTGYDRSYIKDSVMYGRMTAGVREAVCKALNVAEKDIRL